MRTVIAQGVAFFVDDADYERVAQHRWSVVRCRDTVYANTHIDGRTVYMHRMIMDCPAGLETDHRDGHGWNNRRSNLRNCTHAQNLSNQRLSRANTHGFKGVRKTQTRWAAQARIMGINKHIGTFDTKREAAEAYDQFVTQHRGEFAMTNRRLGLLD